MKIMKSKLFLGLICLIVSAAIAFVLLPRFYQSKADTINAVKLSQDVPAGTVLADEMLTTVEVGAYGLPDSVAKEKDGLVGQVVLQTMYSGECLSLDRIVTEEEYFAIVEEQTKGLTAGNCLVSLQFPQASAGVASVLRAGNIVDVYECVENEDGTLSVFKVLVDMHIYDVLNAKLESLHELDEKKATLLVEEDGDFDFEPAYVVFRCTEEQAQVLIRLEKAEAFHLTLSRTEG